MLKSLTLHNFRSHPHTVIDLATGLNILIGIGQAGKTNIKRGIEWLRKNRPLKDRVHSWWCKDGDETYVEAVTVEGTLVRISKKVGGSVEYHITWADGAVDNFRKVSGKVPDKVTLALNLGELNLQGQLDLPYLVTKGTSEISRAVNAVVDLEVADKWLHDLESRGWHNATAITKATVDHKAAVAGLDAYKALPGAEDALVGAETWQTKLFAAQRKAQGLETAMDAVRGANKTVVRLTPAMGAGAILDEADGLYTDLQAKREFTTLLSQLLAAQASHIDLQAKQETITTAYIDLLKQEGLCPTCYTEVTPDTMANIIKELTA